MRQKKIESLSVNNTPEALRKLIEYVQLLKPLLNLIAINPVTKRCDDVGLSYIRDRILEKLEDIEEVMERLNQNDKSALEEANIYINENVIENIPEKLKHSILTFSAVDKLVTIMKEKEDKN